MFTMSRDELYRNSFTDRDDLQEVLEYLMRNFTGIFTNYAYINEESIARSLGMSKRDLCGKLIALSHEGVITYIPAGKLPIITFLAPREDERPDLAIERAPVVDLEPLQAEAELRQSLLAVIVK